MAKLLILGAPLDGLWTINGNYRGLCRIHEPNFNLPKYTEKKRKILENAFDELLDSCSEEDYHFGETDNYAIAKKVAETYTKYSESGEKYEVVEITYPFEYTTYKGNFLGYEVTDGCFGSQIAWVFSDAHENRIAKWNKILKEKYKDKLNKHMLFARLQDAFHFYEESQKMQPPGHRLTIFGIHECLGPQK